MKSLLSRRPSPAMIVALIALFVSLSGVSYGVATGFIDSREIKNNEIRSLDIRNNQVRSIDLRNNEVRGRDIRNSTVQSRDIAINAVTGDDVREDTLQKVPSALLADSATTATTATTANSAQSVGGLTLKRVSYTAEQNTDFVEIFSGGGLRLEARCASGPFIELRANPTAENGWISSQFGGFSNNNNDFDPGDNTLVLDGVGEDGEIAFVAANGDIVTVHGLARQVANGVRGTNDCGFVGVAEAG
jgi:hypothetical protein